MENCADVVLVILNFCNPLFNQTFEIESFSLIFEMYQIIYDYHSISLIINVYYVIC